MELEKIVKESYDLLIGKILEKHKCKDVSVCGPRMKKIEKAFEVAHKAHFGQRRHTGEPYIIHPIAVAIIVADFGLDVASIVAALLHDVVEDTDMTLEDVRAGFGEEVELLVDGLTKISLFTNSTREEKSVEALRKILLSSAKDIRVLMIKLCDRLHNMRTLEELPNNKRERIAKETLHIYAPIAQKIGVYQIKWELEDLSFKYKNPEMFQLIKKKIGLKRGERESIVLKAVNEIKGVLNNNGIDDVIVLGRPKNFYSIYKKIKDKAKSFEHLYDLYAVRIITKNVSDCYLVLGTLHEHFQAFPDRLKDYIANPKANGYQSIHSDIFSKSIEFPVEVQIRTEDMHKMAEYGVAAHWKYKNLKDDKKFEKKISWLREVMQWEKEHKDNTEFLHLLKYDFFQDEIFVFTPKNDLIFLPEGASVLDFAYAVHTEIGAKSFKAKVNGAFTTIDKILKNGDIVDMITHRSAKPSEKWLKFVVTSKAKIKIRGAINLKYSKTPDRLNGIVGFDVLKTKLTRVDEFKKSRKAGCCNIEYGEQVVGVLAKGKEVVIHNASCDNAKYTTSDKIVLNWKEVKKKEVELSIILKDRFGLLIDVLNAFSHFNLNISNMNTKVQKDGTVAMTIKVLDGIYIDSLVEKLKGLDTVQSVRIVRGFLDGILYRR